MSAKSSNCTCATCSGSSCTCGCQDARVPARAACACGEDCRCGPACACQTA